MDILLCKVKFFLIVFLLFSASFCFGYTDAIYVDLDSAEFSGNLTPGVNNVQLLGEAVDKLQGGGGGAVDSVFGRTGAVVAVSGDYEASEVTNAFDKVADDTDDITEGSTNLFFTSAERSKLLGIEAGAEVNNISDANATLLTGGANTTLHYHDADRARANHTGTQTSSTISDFSSTLAGTTNTTPFTPTADEHVATKGYADSVSSAASVQLDWRFDDSTSASDPGNGDFRLNNALVASATALYLSEQTNDGVDASVILNSLTVSDDIYVQNKRDSDEVALYSVSSVTDNGSWLTIGVTFIDSGTATSFTNNREFGFILFLKGSSGGSTSPGGAPTYVQFNDGGSFGGDAGFTYDDATQIVTVGGSLTVADNIDTDTIDSITSLKFDATGSTEGLVTWNDDLDTIDIDSGTGPVLQAGYEFVGLGLNNTGVTIEDCKVVYADDYVGGLPVGGLAKADSFETLEGTIAVTTEEVLDGEPGRFTLMGSIDCDTTGWTNGVKLYADESVAGNLTTSKPIFPNWVKLMGRVAIGDSVDGRIYIAPSGQLSDTFDNEYNCTFREQFNFLVTSDGATITGSLSPRDGHENMTMVFDDGFTTLDTTPPVTVTLTAGTDTNPQFNYVYVPQSTKVLTVSTSGFPTEPYIYVAKVFLQDAGNTQTYNALRNQNINNEVQTTSGFGFKHIIGETVRYGIGAQWVSGSEGTATLVTAPTPDNVYVAITGGKVRQMHDQTTDALDLQTGDTAFVPNHNATPYLAVTDLNVLTTDANGNSWAGQTTSFVMWAAANSAGEATQLFINLPTDAYTVGGFFGTPLTGAINDINNYAVYDIPNEFKGVGYLIARFTFSLNGGGTDWTLQDTEDLRGKIPNITAGGSAGGTGVTTYTGLTDTDSTYSGSAYKVPQVNVGETGLEFTDALQIATVDTTGKITVGTDLDVGGNTEAIGSVTVGQELTVQGTAFIAKRIEFDDGGFIDGIAGGTNTVTIGNSTGPALSVDEVGGTYVGNDLTVIGSASVADDLTVDTNTLYVDSSTNRVGIGTSSPTAELDVVGDVKASGSATISDALFAQEFRGIGTGDAIISSDDTGRVIVDDGLKVSEYLTVGSVIVFRDNSGTAEFSEDNGATWNSIGSAASAGWTETLEGAYLAGDASMSGSMSINESLTVSGDAYFSATFIDFDLADYPGQPNGELRVNGTTIFSLTDTGVNKVSTEGDLTVSNSLTADSIFLADGTEITGGSGGISAVVDDTSPELGGNLDTLTRTIASSTGNVVLDDNVTITGELLTSEPVVMEVSFDLSVNTSFLVYAPLPLKECTVTQWRLCADEAMADDLTISMYRGTSLASNTELTTTKDTRASVGTTEIGDWKTGLSYDFTDQEFLGIKLQDYDNSVDLTRTGYVQMFITVKDRK